MRQRVMLAMALVSSPRLLVADEPTTALDVTIQAEMLELLKELQAESGMAVILITHDLGVVAEIADHAVVMYASRVVEDGPAESVFSRPSHPYTRALFASRPRIDAPAGAPLSVIRGAVPGPLDLPGGCKFHPRCDIAVAECRAREPQLRELFPGHLVRCDLATGEAAG
jgi:oligopeptide/dipeptide ABC transporter ATP-binding protein